jgi:lysozyme
LLRLKPEAAMYRVRIFPMVSLVLTAMLGSCATPNKPAPPPVAAPVEPAASQRVHINAAGLAIIKESEGHNLTPYQDGGHWYVGYGHAVDGPGAAISEEEAETLLQQDLAVCETKVDEAVKPVVSSNEFSAMVSLCYNIGWQNFAASSVVVKFNAADRQGAADAFLLFTKATIDGTKQELPRLRARREKERALFLTPDAPAGV